MSEDTNLNNDLVLAEETKGIKTWVTTSVRGTRTYKFEGDPFPSYLTSDYILTYGASVLDPYDYTISQSANSITIDEPTLKQYCYSESIIYVGVSLCSVCFIGLEK